MSKVKITGHASGSGTLTLTGPNTNSDRTITLPDATGTMLMTDGSGASLTALNGTQVTSGTVPAARLPAGSILQTLFFQYDSAQTISNDSGDGASSGLTLAITPSSTSNKILVFWNQAYQFSATSGAGSGFGVKLMRGGTVAYRSTAGWVDLGYPGNTTEHSRASWMHLDSPSTTSEITYTVNVLTEGGGAVLFNRDNEKTQLVLMEVAG